MCVILTADDVLFICCPPAPDALYVSILKSSGFMSICMSSVISGNTSIDYIVGLINIDEKKKHIS